MKKGKLLIAAVGMVLAAAVPAHAQEQEIVINEQELMPLVPTYLDDAQENGGWDANWFISVHGGVSAFLGKPIGHADLFDRFSPMLNVSLGKWFTPQIGGRLTYQGLKLKDWQLESRPYQSVHADFLYNVSPHFRNDTEALPRWDCIPYFGVGIIRNSYTHHKPFAISYGIVGRYRLNTRLHLSAELGMTNTFQDFDGNGAGAAVLVFVSFIRCTLQFKQVLYRPVGAGFLLAEDVDAADCDVAGRLGGLQALAQILRDVRHLIKAVHPARKPFKHLLCTKALLADTLEISFQFFYC